jgi:phosphoglycolate phosphatase
MTVSTFLFDLDGTLCDSRPGLIHALASAFDALGIETDADLTPFLGAPLPVIFRAALPDIDDIDIEYGLRKFRAAYEAYGIRATPPYPGVVDMLTALKARGRRIWLATSKPLEQAKRVLQTVAMTALFDGVAGAGLDEKDTKGTVIARAMRESGAVPEETLMLGDRAYDVIGALENHVQPVGALWGYGTKAELETAGCSRFATDMADFAARFAAGDVSPAAAGGLGH